MYTVYVLLIWVVSKYSLSWKEVMGVKPFGFFKQVFNNLEDGVCCPALEGLLGVSSSQARASLSGLDQRVDVHLSSSSLGAPHLQLPGRRCTAWVSLLLERFSIRPALELQEGAVGWRDEGF